MNIDKLTAYEDSLIYQAAMETLELDNPFAQITDDDFAQLNISLPKLAYDIHSRLIVDLIYTYVNLKFPQEAEKVMPICFGCEAAECNVVNGRNVDALPQICELLHIAFLNSKFSLNAKSKKLRSKSKEQLIELGAVYTQSHIAESIVKDTLVHLDTPLEAAKILDFACGTGRFYENVISQFSSPTRAILENVYAVDIDINAVHITRFKALAQFNSVTEDVCNTISQHIILKDALRKSNPFFPEPKYIASDDLDGLAEAGFDAIVSNPPYLVLKPNKSKAGVAESNVIQEQLSYFRTCGLYSHSIEGMLNLYQLSIERMLQMLKPHGALGVICPSTLFGDVSASKLRKHLLLCNKVISIKFFAERIPLFDNVLQATNIFILKKGGKTTDISVSEDGETFDVNISLVKELFPENLEIPTIKSVEWNILRKLSSQKKLKQIRTIRNRRGELDLTLCRKYITTAKTPYRLVRGNMIGNGTINDVNGEYVEESFISTRSAEYRTFDFNKKRLICQQISNGGQKRRLKFVFCANGDILGNSCNYISSDDTTLAKMFILLNSSILNWRFRITSSNNHINNYELDELPIIDLSKIDASLSFSKQEDLDRYVCSLYGLSEEEINIVTA